MTAFDDRVAALQAREGFAGMISAAEAEAFARDANVDVPRLMSMLLPFAAAYAKPPVSNFRVGCVSRGASGALYYGTNVEFAGTDLTTTVHAEQSSVTNAWMSGETSIDFIAVTAPPCGYCRQFLNETAGADRLQVAIDGAPRPLADYLPGAFGPRDLGLDSGLMAPLDHRFVIDSDDALALEALRAANRSYAPYSKAYAGVALRAKDGAAFSGAYAENAAFNPSMSPLQVALSRMNLAGRAFDAIADAVLVMAGAPIHLEATRNVLAAVCTAPLRIVTARNAGEAHSG
ncbi:MAG TPA: cytidine deaminase [Thermoanaerobaculia bacterium]